VLDPLYPVLGPDGGAGPAVVIASDPESRYERTIAVLDALAAVGIQRVSLAGEEERE
jgi:biopolymer transport protein ExbD